MFTVTQVTLRPTDTYVRLLESWGHPAVGAKKVSQVIDTNHPGKIIASTTEPEVAQQICALLNTVSNPYKLVSAICNGVNHQVHWVQTAEVVEFFRGE